MFVVTGRENPEQPRRKRPLGATLLSLVLGWLTLSALGNAAFLMPVAGFPAPMIALALAYAATAGAAAAGLWRMKSWGLTAFRAWGVILLCLMVGFLWAPPLATIVRGNLEENPLVFLASMAVMVFVYWLMYRYIKRRLVPGAG